MTATLLLNAFIIILDVICLILVLVFVSGAGDAEIVGDASKEVP